MGYKKHQVWHVGRNRDEQQWNRSEHRMTQFFVDPKKKTGICAWSPASPMFSQTQKYNLIVKVTHIYI